jgi:sortase A
MENVIAGILAVIGLVEIYVLIYLVSIPRHARKRVLVQRLEKVNVFLALFFVITLGAFVSMNGPAYAENISFELRNTFGGGESEPTEEIFHLPSANATEIPVPGSPMELIIPKINVRTPIVFPKDSSVQGVLKSLEGGVGVYPGSIMPGQDGRMILLGHSSLASWYNGDYARVFALLKNLEAGDEFTIVSGGNQYTYKVFSNRVLKPAATDAYLADPARGSVLELITCDPVGSAANRRIVSAVLLETGQ